jgi:hypothetical protein
VDTEEMDVDSLPHLSKEAFDRILAEQGKPLKIVEKPRMTIEHTPSMPSFHQKFSNVQD